MHTRRDFLRTSTVFMGATALPGVALAGGHGRLGTFTGESNHVTTGTVEVVTSGGSSVIELKDDFFFDGAPDPKVALGRDGYDASTLMGPLRDNTGAQNYEVPEGIDAADYNEVWIWCERFNVPLGVAKLG